MANFVELNKSLDKFLMKLISSQDLCKMLSYDVTSALVKDDLEDTSELLFTKIFPFPKDVKLLEKASSILIVGFDNFRPINAGTFNSNIIYFVILCHQTLWRLNGDADCGLKLRPYLLMNEIAKLFNGQRVTGIGTLEFNGANQIRDGEYFGFQLAYKITEFSKEHNVLTR